MGDVPLLSLRVRPLSLLELMVLRLISRLQSDADALVRSVLRLRFLRSSIGSSFGWRAERGLALAEAAVLLLLAARPAATAEEVRRKGVIIRDFLGEDPHGNADAMLAAAVEADLSRLGLIVSDHACDRDGVVVH